MVHHSKSNGLLSDGIVIVLSVPGQIKENYKDLKESEMPEDVDWAFKQARLKANG